MNLLCNLIAFVLLYIGLKVCAATENKSKECEVYTLFSYLGRRRASVQIDGFSWYDDKQLPVGTVVNYTCHHNRPSSPDGSAIGGHFTCLPDRNWLPDVEYVCGQDTEGIVRLVSGTSSTEASTGTKSEQQQQHHDYNPKREPGVNKSFQSLYKMLQSKGLPDIPAPPIDFHVVWQRHASVNLTWMWNGRSVDGHKIEAPVYFRVNYQPLPKGQNGNILTRPVKSFVTTLRWALLEHLNHRISYKAWIVPLVERLTGRTDGVTSLPLTIVPVYPQGLKQSSPAYCDLPVLRSGAWFNRISTPSDVPRLSNSGTVASIGSRYQLRCRPGYALPSGVSLGNLFTCSAGGRWRPDLPYKNGIVLSCVHLNSNLDMQIRQSNLLDNGDEYTKRTGSAEYDNRGCLPLRLRWPNIFVEYRRASPKTTNMTSGLQSSEWVEPRTYGVPRTRYSPGDTATLKCMSGRLLLGPPQTRRCLSDGRWTHSVVPQCAVPDGCMRVPDEGNRRHWYSSPGCKNPQDRLNMKCLDEIGDVVIPGTVVYFECENADEYYLEGERMFTCGRSSDWIPPPKYFPKCRRKRKCPAMPFPKNGFIIERRGVAAYQSGETIEFGCAEGYELAGPSTSRCLEDGVWSSDSPACSKVVFRNKRLIALIAVASLLGLLLLTLVIFVVHRQVWLRKMATGMSHHHHHQHPSSSSSARRRRFFNAADSPAGRHSDRGSRNIGFPSPEMSSGGSSGGLSGALNNYLSTLEAQVSSRGSGSRTPSTSGTSLRDSPNDNTSQTATSAAHRFSAALDIQPDRLALIAFAEGLCAPPPTYDEAIGTPTSGQSAPSGSGVRRPLSYNTVGVSSEDMSSARGSLVNASRDLDIDNDDDEVDNDLYLNHGRGRRTLDTLGRLARRWFSGRRQGASQQQQQQRRRHRRQTGENSEAVSDYYSTSRAPAHPGSGFVPTDSPLMAVEHAALDTAAPVTHLSTQALGASPSYFSEQSYATEPFAGDDGRTIGRQQPLTISLDGGSNLSLLTRNASNSGGGIEQGVGIQMLEGLPNDGSDMASTNGTWETMSANTLTTTNSNVSSSRSAATATTGSNTAQAGSIDGNTSLSVDYNYSTVADNRSSSPETIDKETAGNSAEPPSTHPQSSLHLSTVVKSTTSLPSYSIDAKAQAMSLAFDNEGCCNSPIDDHSQSPSNPPNSTHTVSTHPELVGKDLNSVDSRPHLRAPKCSPFDPPGSSTDSVSYSPLRHSPQHGCSGEENKYTAVRSSTPSDEILLERTTSPRTEPDDSISSNYHQDNGAAGDSHTVITESNNTPPRCQSRSSHMEPEPFCQRDKDARMSSCEYTNGANGSHNMDIFETGRRHAECPVGDDNVCRPSRRLSTDPLDTAAAMFTDADDVQLIQNSSSNESIG